MTDNITRPNRRQTLGLLAGGAAAAVLGAPAMASSGQTLRYGHPVPAKTVYHEAIVTFGKELEKLSGGKYKMQVFPASQLGPISEMLQSVQAGVLDFSMAVPAWYSSFMKPMDVFTLPYLTESTDRLRTALDGDVGVRIREMGRGIGFEIVGQWLMGQRHIVNRVRPVASLTDLEGLKLRVINSEVYMTGFRAMGANPVAMDPSELYLALQQGVIDGFEFPLLDLLDQKLYEVAEYVSLDAHTTDFFITSMSPKAWSAMPEEDQAMVEAAMKIAMDWQWQAQPEATEAARAELEERVTVTEIGPEQKQAFVQATRPIYAQFEDSIGKDWLEQCIAALGASA